MNPRATLPAVLLLSMVLASSANAELSHVHAEMIANVSAVAPGKPFLVGVKLTVDPGWHVYWKNPGDAGMATHVKFTVPEGFSVGELQFPTPERFDQAGNIVAFGYETSVLLWAQVTPPKDHLPTGNDFSADISWLVCSSVCIPGKQTVVLSLPAGNDSPANAAIFDKWTAQLPVAASASPEVASVKSTGSLKPDGDHFSGVISVEIAWKTKAPDKAQFLPGSIDQYAIKDVKVSSDGKITHITFGIQTLAGQKADPAKLETVVGYKNKDGDRRGISFTISLPDSNSGNNP